MTTKQETPQTQEPSAYDEMASVFNSIVDPLADDKAGGDGSAAPAAEGNASSSAEGATPPSAEGDAAPTPPAPSPGAEGEGEPAGQPTPPAEPEPAKEPEAATPDWETRFRELEAQVRAQRQPEQAPEKPPVETPPPDAAPPLYSKDEDEFLKKYAEDWPDIVRGESLRRRQEYVQLVDHVFKEISRVYGPMLERSVAAADTVAESTTLQAIRSVHNDYNDVMYDDVVAWADSLTGFRQKYAKQVISDGEPQDVIDLITEYKSAKGLNKPKVVAGTSVPTPTVTELPAAAKQAAKALGVVDSKRSAATTNVSDPDDFDGAWNEAVGR